MGITNAIQGLNQTVELLSKILANIEASNKGGEATRGTSSGGGKTTSLDGLGSAVKILEKVDAKKSKDNASTAASIFKDIFNADYIKNMLALATHKRAIKSLKSIFEDIILAMNTLNTLQVDKGTVKNFKEVADAIVQIVEPVTNVIMGIPKLLLGLAGAVVAALAVGFLVIHFWPQILAGFTAMIVFGAVTLFTFIAISTFASKMGQKGGAVGASNNILGSLLGSSAKDISSAISSNAAVTNMVIFLLSIAGLIIISLAVSYLVTNFFAPIVIGFASIAVVAAALAGLMFVIRSAGRNGANTLKFVAALILFIVASVLLIVVSAALGLFIEAYITPILYGMSAMVIVVTAMIFLMKTLSKIDMKELGKGGIVLGALIVTLLVLVYVVGCIVSVAEQANKMGGLAGAWGVVALMTVVFLIIGAIAIAAIALGVLVFTGVGGAAIAAGIGVLLSIVAALITLVVAVKLIVDIAAVAKTVGIAPILGVVALMGGITAFMLGLTALLGGLAATGIGAAVILAGVGILTALSGALIILGVAVKQMVDIAFIIKERNITKEDFRSFGIIGEGIAEMVSALSSAGKHAGKIAKLAAPLYAIVQVVADFIDIISKFGVDSTGTMRVLNIDKDGKATMGPRIDIPKIATAISSAMEMFVLKLKSMFENFDNKHKKSIRKGCKSMKRALEPLSMLVDIIAKTQKHVKETNIEGIANKLSNAFSTFVTTIGEVFKKIEPDAQTAIAKISGPTMDLMKNIHNLATSIKTLANLDTKDADKAASTLASAVSKVFNAVPQEDKELAAKQNRMQTALGAIDTMLKGVSPNYALFRAGADWLDGKVKSSNMEAIAESTDKYNESAEKSEKIIAKQIDQYKKLADAIKEVAISLERMNAANVRKDALASVEIKESAVVKSKNTNSTQYGDTYAGTNSVITKVDSASIASAIKSALSGNTIRVAFNDSREDILGQMSIL